jgi:hypothetical protein
MNLWDVDSIYTNYTKSDRTATSCQIYTLLQSFKLLFWKFLFLEGLDYGV